MCIIADNLFVQLARTDLFLFCSSQQVSILSIVMEHIHHIHSVFIISVWQKWVKLKGGSAVYFQSRAIAKCLREMSVQL